MLAEAAKGGGALFRPIVDPRTGEVIGRVQLATSEDVERALSAADAAARVLCSESVAARGRYLTLASDWLNVRLETLARDYSREQGKRLREARDEWVRAIETLRYVADDCVSALADVALVPRAGWQRVIGREPGGVTAAFVPWNFPVVIAARKLASALAAGNPVLLKGPEECPASVLPFAEALCAAGAPAGTLAVLFGEPEVLARQLISARQVRQISFTGSTRVGRIIAEQAARELKPAVLELGGHAPVLVLEDADVEAAAECLAPAKLASAGQSCGAPSRFFVARARYEHFARRLTEHMQRLGSARSGEEALGPVQHAARLVALESLVEDAVSRGARLKCGGAREPRPGFYFAPTVLLDVPAEARIMHEEPFGPIAPLRAFDDLECALAEANACSYALSAYVFSSSSSLGERVARRLNAGVVTINRVVGAQPDCPLGGRGDSGYGYEGGRAGLEQFTRIKVIQSQTPETR